MPWHTVGRAGTRTVQFAPGSIWWAGRIPLLVAHTWALRVGWVTDLADTPHGLRVSARVSPRARTPHRGLSAGVDLDATHHDGAVIVVTRARLLEVSLVPAPLFSTAQIDTAHIEE